MTSPNPPKTQVTDAMLEAGEAAMAALVSENKVDRVTLEMQLRRIYLAMTQARPVDEMIKRMAKAIATSFERGSPTLAADMRMDWQSWAEEARAALEAMEGRDGR